ncbi:acyl-CoA carboxylase subunit epsilon [Rhodococcus sp. Z13]|uniref:Acyl-CoA carboxylase subunit epsilon n=1 Tax=Rhodococcus sacchari TaxID=2962047 RepID=A0ACD4DCU7_9NOCA|nr:acyl-CoA carboxylase subunit epsilon [Rhodococcus sp. Z13]UYP17859.1 acyl-CoA carboxylase subunit epsilon [Rhodococcus sp. Z13]
MTATAEDKIITEFEADQESPVVGVTASDETAPVVEETPAEPATAPALRIVKGNPTDEDVAVLVAVLSAAAASAGGEDGDGKPAETWGDPTRMHRQWAPFSPYSYPNRG